MKEIEDAAPFTRGEINEIYLMEKHSMAQIKCSDIMAWERIKKEAIKLFYCTIQTAQIEKERLVNVRQCYRCFAYAQQQQ